MKKTKHNKALIEKIDTSKIYDPIEAIQILKDNSYTKFEETLEVAINLGIDSNKTDQNIRGVLNLPKGTGKKIKVAVLAKGEKQNEGKAAGADIVGESDLIESISSGKIDFAPPPMRGLAERPEAEVCPPNAATWAKHAHEAAEW